MPCVSVCVKVGAGLRGLLAWLLQEACGHHCIAAEAVRQAVSSEWQLPAVYPKQHSELIIISSAAAQELWQRCVRVRVCVGVWVCVTQVYTLQRACQVPVCFGRVWGPGRREGRGRCGGCNPCAVICLSAPHLVFLIPRGKPALSLISPLPLPPPSSSSSANHPVTGLGSSDGRLRLRRCQRVCVCVSE